jgi:enoyl-CoA hydratase/carnithine racemase
VTYSQICYDVTRAVATITLNRPERLNAWTPTMAAEFREAMEQANNDPQVRAIIVTGAGKGFCSGVDMNALEANRKSQNSSSASPSPAAAPLTAAMIGLPTEGSQVIGCWKSSRAAGLGLALLLFCDLRFASSNAAFVTSFSRRGLIAEHGTSWMLTRLVGHSRALDLMFSSRRVDGDEAYRIGLADRVCAPERLLDEAREYAENLAANVSPRSTRIMKRQLWDALFVDLATSMQDADEEMRESLKSADFKEGVAHFLEKRPAKFIGS